MHKNRKNYRRIFIFFNDVQICETRLSKPVLLRLQEKIKKIHSVVNMFQQSYIFFFVFDGMFPAC